MRSLAAVLVLVGCGCDYFLRLDEVPLPDAAPPDAPPYACDMPTFEDTFPMPITGAPCEIWDFPYTDHGATMVQGNGKLVITPDATMAYSDGGCSKAPVKLGQGGIAAQVTDVIVAANAYTTLQIYFDLTSGYQIKVTGAQRLVFQDTDSTPLATDLPFDPQTMSWWRLRPSADYTMLFAEYGDGATWKQLGEIATTVPTSVDLELSAGINELVPVSGTATYTHVLACP